MGDFLDQVVIFLEAYYVYVIGVGLIIIFMLIGYLSSKRKERKKEKQSSTMANINDVKTGSIDEVASTLNSDLMKPVDVAALSGNPSVVTNETPATPMASVATPVAAVEPIIVTDAMATPLVVETPKPEAPTISVVEPELPKSNVILDAPKIEPEKTSGEYFAALEQKAMPTFAFDVPAVPAAPVVAPAEEVKQPVVGIPVVNAEDNLEKTEVIDLSSIMPAAKPEEPASDFKPFIIDKSQFTDISANPVSGESTSDKPAV